MGAGGAAGAARSAARLARAANGPGGSRTHTSLAGQRILSPLRLPFRHGPEEADSTGDSEILEAIRERDWERLGGLLGALEPELAVVLSAWSLLTLRQKAALAALAQP